MSEKRTTTLGRATGRRQLYRLHARVQHILYLRAQALLDLLSIANAPYCFLDQEIACIVARYIRNVTLAQAILDPSMGLLDPHQRHRWNAILVLEKLPSDPREFLTEVAPITPAEGFV